MLVQCFNCFSAILNLQISWLSVVGLQKQLFLVISDDSMTTVSCSVLSVQLVLEQGRSPWTRPRPGASILLLLSPYVIHFCYQTFNFTLVFSSFVPAPAVVHVHFVAYFLLSADLFIYISTQLTSPWKSSIILKTYWKMQLVK